MSPKGQVLITEQDLTMRSRLFYRSDKAGLTVSFVEAGVWSKIEANASADDEFRHRENNRNCENKHGLWK
ncbi:MAG: hypothetical protein Alpg2KO_00260 [Alphaproteobacteria bacterium]